MHTCIYTHIHAYTHAVLVTGLCRNIIFASAPSLLKASCGHGGTNRGIYLSWKAATAMAGWEVPGA